MSEMETRVDERSEILGWRQVAKVEVGGGPGVEWAFDPSGAQTDATDIDIGVDDTDVSGARTGKASSIHYTAHDTTRTGLATL